MNKWINHYADFYIIITESQIDKFAKVIEQDETWLEKHMFIRLFPKSSLLIIIFVIYLSICM